MTEHQSARMSKIKTGGLDQYGADPSNSNLEQLALKGLKWIMQEG